MRVHEILVFRFYKTIKNYNSYLRFKSLIKCKISPSKWINNNSNICWKYLHSQESCVFEHYPPLLLSYRIWFWIPLSTCCKQKDNRDIHTELILYEKKMFIFTTKNMFIYIFRVFLLLRNPLCPCDSFPTPSLTVVNWM